jgi:hypothetical protein
VRFFNFNNNFFRLYLEIMFLSSFSLPSASFVSCWDSFDRYKHTSGGLQYKKYTLEKTTTALFLTTGETPIATRQLLRGGVEAATITRCQTGPARIAGLARQNPKPLHKPMPVGSSGA